MPDPTATAAAVACLVEVIDHVAYLCNHAGRDEVAIVARQYLADHPEASHADAVADCADILHEAYDDARIERERETTGGE